ncbi:SH3 domain-containing protein [Enterococcus sp. 22-H-5-01]|uniref:SH3 domain-containing protein n=1 Tax=Enterococcus sp. 22-H-5-01 TaxID=3418555 RepID=UPI003CFD0343
MKRKIVLLSLLMALFLLPIQVHGYTVNNEFNLGPNEGSTQLAQNRYIIVHDTANPSATGRNEATYMKRNWQNAYTTHIVGDGIVYQVGQPGYVSWGALNANPYAPAQIELQATPDRSMFAKNYPVYIELIRDMCDRFGIPKTLDNIYGTNGAKSHLWVTNNYGGDHTDPYGYLASMGVSQAKFARDIQEGLKSNNGATAIPTPTPAPTPVPKPTDTYENVNGSYTFAYETRIRNGVGLNGQDSGLTYEASQSVSYDRIYHNVDGYDWLSYISYSGQRRYIAMTGQGSGQNTPSPAPAVKNRVAQDGTYQAKGTMNVRSAPSTTASVVATYYGGQTFTYDSYVDSEGTRWVSYVSYSGERRYVARRTLDWSVVYGNAY